MKKKTISLLLVLALMVGICPAAFAHESDFHNETSIETFNEYDYVIIAVIERMVSHMAPKKRNLILKVLIGVPLAFFGGVLIQWFPFGLLGETTIAIIGWSVLIICLTVAGCACALMGDDEKGPSSQQEKSPERKDDRDM